MTTDDRSSPRATALATETIALARATVAEHSRPPLAKCDPASRRSESEDHAATAYRAALLAMPAGEWTSRRRPHVRRSKAGAAHTRPDDRRLLPQRGAGLGDRLRAFRADEAHAPREALTSPYRESAEPLVVCRPKRTLWGRLRSWWRRRFVVGRATWRFRFRRLPCGHRDRKRRPYLHAWVWQPPPAWCRECLRVFTAAEVDPAGAYASGARSIPVDAALLLPSAARVRFFAVIARGMARHERVELLRQLLEGLDDKDAEEARVA